MTDTFDQPLAAVLDPEDELPAAIPPPAFPLPGSQDFWPADESHFDLLAQGLADTLAQRRLIILRERGLRIPLAPVLEFMAAIAIEAALLLIMIFLGHMGGFAGHGGNAGGHHPATPSAAVGGILIPDTLTAAPQVPQNWRLSAHIPRPPTLPSTVHLPVVLRFAHPDNSRNGIIGIADAAHAWAAPTPDVAPRFKVRRKILKTPARSRGPQPAQVARLVRSRSANPNAGFGAPVSLLKGQGSGSGSSGGNARGRGLADASRGIGVLEWGPQHIPIKYQIDPVPMKGEYMVSVSAAAEVTKVAIVKSCGHPSMDQSFIDTLERTKFSPAISNGIPHDSKIPITMSFGNP